MGNTLYHQRTSSQDVVDTNGWHQLMGKGLIDVCLVFEINMMFFQTKNIKVALQNCPLSSNCTFLIHFTNTNHLLVLQCLK